jgi:hypothetical protein
VADEFDRGFAPLSSPVAELAADPQARRWALDCAWMPGTGHCRNRPCAAACLFRAQRKSEAERLMRLRRLRRSTQAAMLQRGSLALVIPSAGASLR